MIKMTTKEFLTSFPNFFLQTFDDKGENKSLISCGKPSKEYWERIIKMNKKGAGVFFTPNQFTERRKKDMCSGVNAWFFEIDDIPKKAQWELINKSPLKPSLVVETSKSLHTYFIANDGQPQAFETIQKGLIQYFKADPACKDISRVLRIPGFFHNKKAPYMVEVKYYSLDSYDEKEMLKAFPYTEEGKTHTKTIIDRSGAKEGMDFWESAFNLNCKNALIKLSGAYAMNGEFITFKPRTSGGEYILVNNIPADAWIDTTGMIGSGKGAGPSIIQWLQYYGHTKAEIAEIIKKHFHSELPKSAVGTEKKEITAEIQPISKVFDELKEFNFEVLPCNYYLDQHDIFVRGSVTRIGAWSNIGKSKFSYYIAKQFLMNGKKGAIFSTEVPRPIVLANIIQSIDEVEYKAVIKDKKDPSNKAKKLCENLSIYDGRDGSYYLKSIREIIAKHNDLDFVIVDFCQDVADIENNPNEYVRMSNYAIETQRIAQEQQICFIDLSQVSNEQAKTQNGYASGFLGLKGSGHLYSKGDVVLGLEKDVSNINSKFIIDIKKHKYGKKETIQCEVDFRYNRFYQFEKADKSNTF